MGGWGGGDDGAVKFLDAQRRCEACAPVEKAEGVQQVWEICLGNAGNAAGKRTKKVQTVCGRLGRDLLTCPALLDRLGTPTSASQRNPKVFPLHGFVSLSGALKEYRPWIAGSSSRIVILHAEVLAPEISAGGPLCMWVPRLRFAMKPHLPDLTLSHPKDSSEVGSRSIGVEIPGSHALQAAVGNSFLRLELGRLAA